MIDLSRLEAPPCRAYCAPVAVEALNGFTDDEAAQIVALLQRVRGNLSRLVDR
nr:hypothetical protein [Paraburkholderia rhynchosiae]